MIRRATDNGTVAPCTCDPRHVEIGGYDPGCPRHDTAGATR